MSLRLDTYDQPRIRMSCAAFFLGNLNFNGRNAYGLGSRLCSLCDPLHSLRLTPYHDDSKIQVPL